MEACLELFTSTQVTNILFILWIIDDHSSHDVNLEHLFDFYDETGILETLRQRYSQENFTNEEDLKIVFSDLIRESFKIYPIWPKMGEGIQIGASLEIILISNIFEVLLRHLCDYVNNNGHRPLTKIDGYQQLTNMLIMEQFETRNFYI